jgi:FHS family Na+ dependent glucose MFS transporter 1
MRKGLISVSYFLAFGGLGLVIASLGPIMLALSEQVEAELNELAFIFSSRATGYLAGSILGGLLVDRVPGHRLLFASLCLTAVATALIPLATSVGVLAVLTSMQGLAMGFLDTAGNVLFLWLHGDQNGPWLQAMHCCFAVGAVLSPLFARAAEDVTGSFHLAFWAFSAILLATGICFLFLPSPKPPQEPGPAGAAGFLSALRRLSSSNVSLLLVVATMLGVYVGSEVAFGGYVLTYSHLRLEFDEAQGQFLTAVYWGALAGGRFFAIFLSMRMTPRTVLWLDLIGCVLSSALILVWNASPVAGQCSLRVQHGLHLSDGPLVGRELHAHFRQSRVDLHHRRQHGRALAAGARRQRDRIAWATELPMGNRCVLSDQPRDAAGRACCRPACAAP